MGQVYPKISIVTPSFNQGKYIREAIKSVMQQDYPDFEHIIIDNCSADDTTAILKEYGHLKWVSEPDGGQSDALNKGFKKATGDIVGWLNADDRYLMGCFKKVSDYFRDEKQTDLIYGDYRLIDAQGNILQSRRELDFDLFMLKYLHVLYIPSTSTFFRRRIFLENNFLDNSYHYSMDYEFFLRLALKGYRFDHIHAFLADFRSHAKSKSLSALVKQKQELRRALLTHDDFLKGLIPPLQGAMRKILMGSARIERYFLKGIKGYYWRQMVNA